MEIKKNIFRFLSLAFVLTASCGVSYFLVHQDLRQSANDPQIQMAEDNVSPQNLPLIDISKSLAPFVIVFDEKGNPTSSSGTLNDAIPIVPPGIFQNVQISGEERLTWQPASGVRIAAVIDRVSGPNPGFILVGRNIREIENREDHFLLIAAGVWAIGIFGLIVLEGLSILIP